MPIPSDYVTGPTPPAFAGAEDTQRQTETQRRRRMLSGIWRADLALELARRVGSKRAKAWVESPILETNPFNGVCKELAVLYVEAPMLKHESASPGSLASLASDLETAQLWGLMGRVQRFCLGLREMLVRVSVENGRIVFREVYPDLCYGRSREDRPDQPVMLAELRQRSLEGLTFWTFDYFDLSDPENPLCQIRAVGKGGILGEDLSAAFWKEERSGEKYPYRRRDGSPFIPYVLYHAEPVGDRLWSPYDWSEIVEGSVSLAVKYNMLDHVFVQASWPQRYILGAEVDGVGEGANQRELITDPAVLLQLRKQEDFEGQPVIGQWAPAADVDKLEAVLESLSAKLAVEAGVNASDVNRLNSQRSGVSISLTNEGKRAQQRRFAPVFRDPDSRLVAMAATLLNRAREATGETPIYAEGGYKVLYRELPLSPSELESRRKNILELLDARLVSRTDAYLELNPGLTRTMARTELARIDAEENAAPGEQLSQLVAGALAAAKGGDLEGVTIALQEISQILTMPDQPVYL